MISKRHEYTATVAALLLLFLASCDRKAQNTEDTKALRNEVQSLREELARQKAASPSSATPAQMLNTPATRLVTSPEFVEFVRTSRRIVSAMGTGVAYTDFKQRLVDINASAEEVLPQIADATLKAKIANFVLSLNDANELWRCEANSRQPSLRLQKVSGEYIPYDPSQLSDRWSLKFPDLVNRYDLRDEANPPFSPIIDYGHPTMDFDRALQHIFTYASTLFREIEHTE